MLAFSTRCFSIRRRSSSVKRSWEVLPWLAADEAWRWWAIDWLKSMVTFRKKSHTHRLRPNRRADLNLERIIQPNVHVPVYGHSNWILPEREDVDEGVDQAVLSAHEVRVADLLLETLQWKLNEPVDGVAQHGLKNCQQKWLKSKRHLHFQLQ